MNTIDFTDSIYDAQQGSQSAVKFIYDNTIQLFNKEAAALMKNPAEADEAVRDAYIFIFDHLNSLEDTSKFLLWATEVCKNTCIAKLKQQNVFSNRIPAEAANLGEVLSADDFDSAVNMDASMEPDHIRVCLAAVLDALPDDQRVCAVLWGEGYPLRSISRKLGISTVAVNYTIACTLGSITNAVNTLSENGLPLYSMDPIPYFLWLLINYYQLEPEEGTMLGDESSFINVLRILMPEEASLYDAAQAEDNDAEVSEAEDASSEFFEEFEAANIEKTVAPGYEEEMYSDIAAGSKAPSEYKEEGYDISDFINGGSQADSKVKLDFDAESDTELPVPPMDIYPAEDSIFTQPEGSRDKAETKKDDTDSTETADKASEESENKEETAGATAEAAAEDGTQEAAENEETSESKSDAPAEGLSIADQLLSDLDAANKPAPVPADKISEGDKNIRINSESAEADKPKKSHKGLIITLIIILVIACLIAAAFIFYGKTVKSKVNEIFGRQIFTIEEETTAAPETEPAAEPETETTTEPETTTVEETTTEPETTTAEEFTGSEYKVQIYAEGEALAIKAEPDGERLGYIPSDTEVTITETTDGWGHTVYEDMDGWIWLNWTKVSGQAPVEKPSEESVLETPETHTVYADTELRISPTDNTSTFGPIPAGTEVTIEAYMEGQYGDTWCYTSYNGNHGWIPASSIE